MESSQSAWQELAQLLTEEPDTLAFRAVCSVLDTWRGDDQVQAIAYVADKLAAWPDETRLATWAWCKALAAGATKSSWSLVRSLELFTYREGCETVLTQDLAASPWIQGWSSLKCFPYGYQGDCAANLFAFPEHWQGLRHLYGLTIDSLDQFHQFFSSPIAHQLETLQVYYHLMGAHSSPKFDLIDVTMPQALVNLRSLDAQFWNATDISSTLDAAHFPKLDRLRLEASWPFDPAPTPESFQHLLTLPLLRQICTLTTNQYPEDVLVALFSRHDLLLESLSLVNRPYRGDVEYQEFAYRLTLAGLKAIINSGAVRSARHLKVEHERVGDDVLRMIEATTPGTLEQLELIDVGLTDEGVAWLAQLPHLANVTDLTLRSNTLTAKGVEALTQSPYLSHLRNLDLGSEAHNPYYSIVKPQVIGDAGISTLARSGLSRQLRSLRLANAGIGADGISALANAQDLSELRVLDLSHNPIGAHGFDGFANTSVLRSVRDLNLSVCKLDDTSIGDLMQSDWSNLRVLNLAYNAIAEGGAQWLAETPTLSSLWVLNLHDNFIGDKGLIALARSPWLKKLLEFDIEQDVWNSRRAQFSQEAAQVVAQSSTLARLDTFWAGIVDEYHGERIFDPFKRHDAETDMDLIVKSGKLRPEVRYSVKAYQRHYDPDEEARIEASQQAQKASFEKLFTPEKLEEMRRSNDFRTRHGGASE